MSMHKHGGDIYTQNCRIDYSANINPLGTPENVIEAACEGVRRSASYPDVFCRELIRALAEAEQVKEEELLCGNGAAELIFSLAAAAKPRKALLVTPGFAEYEQALQAAGCEISYYELEEKNGFILTEDYLKELSPELDMIFLCVPNNPTGMVYSSELLEKILKLCQRFSIRMVVDECFQEFLDDSQRCSMKEFMKQADRLFILKAFTKTYAMAGIRLGYGMCSDRGLLEAMGQVMQPWNVSLPAQMAGVAALREKEFVEESRRLIKRERTWLKAGLFSCGFQVFDSQANFIFFKGKKGLFQACKEQGILIRDCSNYRGLGPGYYRIAVRTRKENEELLQVLKTIQERMD